MNFGIYAPYRKNICQDIIITDLQEYKSVPIMSV